MTRSISPFRHAFAAAALLLGLPVCAPALASDDGATQRVFQSLYGDEIRQVRNSLNPSDDVELAERLLSDARSLSARPGLATMMADSAYELGSRDQKGYETAIDAARFLMGLAPEERGAALQKILNLQQRNYRLASGPSRLDHGQDLLHTLVALADVKAESDSSADLQEAISLYLQAERTAGSVQYPHEDDIVERRNRAAMRSRALSRIELLQTRLINNPRIQQPREDILRLYLVEMDKPQKAMEYVEDVANPQLTKHVPLAVEPLESLTEDELVMMAEWYDELAESAPLAARPSMLRRSRAYYQQFVQIHPEEDLRRLKAELAIKKVNETLGDDGQTTDHFEHFNAQEPRHTATPSAPEEQTGEGESEYDMFGF